MSDESLEKHIQLDGREEPKKTTIPSPYLDDFPGGGSGSGGSGGGGVDNSMPNGAFKQFYRDLVMVLTEPRLFFEIRYTETSFNYALAFGIVVAWIAAFLSWLTRVVKHETLMDGFLSMRDKLQGLPIWKNLPDNFWAQNAPDTTSLFPSWLAELGGIIISPFFSLLGMAFYGIVILIGCYLLVPRDPRPGKDTLELKNTIRIVAFASAPVLVSAILGFLPFGMGGLIGNIYLLILLVYGLAIRFRVSNLRAFGVVILPGILGFVVLGCVIGGFAAILIALFGSIFGGMHS